MTNKAIYLDYNSTTPVDERVLQKMLPYFTQYYGNASSKTHSYGWEADAAVSNARQQVAALIHASPEEIFFTSGATEAINIALHGVAEVYGPGSHIITCSTEHKAVLDTCMSLEKKGLKVSYLRVDHEGIIDLEELQSVITSKTVMVCIMHANNETGVIQPVNEIGEICRERKVFFFTDATQSAGKLRIDVNEMHGDLLSLSAHKIYGPKGCGALYKRRRNPSVRLAPLMTGGGHENGVRPGTLNVPGIVGLGAACMLAAEVLWDESSHLSALRTVFEQSLENELKVVINGSIRHRLPNTTNICFTGLESSRLIKAVPQLAFSTGSACTSALPEPSHVLKAMGFADDHVYSSVRFSIGRFTTEKEISNAILLLVDAVNKEKVK